MAIGTLTGTFLAPGVSKNGRLYTKKLIADSVEDMSARLAAGKPIQMMASHSTDNTLEQCAAIREVWTDEDGKGKYRADIPDTTAGRDLAALTSPGPDGESAYLNSVSIYGGWVGGTRTVEHEGQDVQTGDKLLITRVDWVGDPGVEDARLDPQSAPGEMELIEAAGGAFTPISESAPPARFRDSITEDTPPASAEPVSEAAEAKARPRRSAAESARLRVGDGFAALDESGAHVFEDGNCVLCDY